MVKGSFKGYNRLEALGISERANKNELLSGSGSIGFRGAAKDITFSAEARKISRPDHRGTFPFQKDH